MEQPQAHAPASGAPVQTEPSLYRDVYDDTLYFIEGITSEYDFYPEILRMLREGDVSVELKKKYTLKSIDELWVRVIEEALPALDSVIRAPGHFIEEQETLLPVELSHGINRRSMTHLAQRTDYISRIEGDDITPSKLLNVLREETVQTYENRFINTLVQRLFGFISRRYDAIFGSGRSERSTELSLTGTFRHGSVKGKLHFGIELSEAPESHVRLDGRQWSVDLDRRVERLYRVAQGYMSSAFIKRMGQSYVRPPIMRTNPIMKNKNLRQCLALWEFIESYEGTGYEVLVRESAEKLDEGYISELYHTCALQYLIFRYQIRNEFETENELAHAVTSEPLRPKFVDKLKPLCVEEYNLFDTQYRRVVPYGHDRTERRLSASELRIGHAIDIALEADPLFDRARLEAGRRRAEEEAHRLEEEARRRSEREDAPHRMTEVPAPAERAHRRAERNKGIGRKSKKRIRRAAEEKAAREAVTLSDVFNYDEYTRFLHDTELPSSEREK